LHIGGARTALFNWLFARHHGGSFILRIEDTDRERSTKEFEESILQGMKWLGINWDEGPFYQTERMDIYKTHVKKLLDDGRAFLCTCTQAELDLMREKAMASGANPKYDGSCRTSPKHPDKPAVVRFRAPDSGTTEFHDICRGTITFDNSQLDDLIIARSDGTPTYNFTVVVDDVTMGITHVIRGDDHINNTPKQVLLYQALGYEVPQFAHLPMIHGPDKKKLSKRHGAASVTEYRDMGFLPEAMVNYLARLGWAHGDQEIFTLAELIEKFDLPEVGNSASVFDAEKLTWVNAQHMMNLPARKLLDFVMPFLNELGLASLDSDYAEKVITTTRERAHTLKELAAISTYFFTDKIEMDESAVAKWLDAGGISILTALEQKLSGLISFDAQSLSQIFKSLAEEKNLKMVNLAQPVRVALTGNTASPGIYEVMETLGREKTLSRIKRAISSRS
jgi:glutamyl-tRNA synthetase